MEIQQDFKDLLELFNAHKVEYIIVGGYALAFHGAPRYTGDIDIITSISGVSCNEAFSHRAPGKYGDIQVHYIGHEQFIMNKRAVGRKKDLADLEALGEQ